MWSRPAAAFGLLLLAGAALCSAQTPGTYSRALPPDPAALARLNLQTEWSLNLPIESRRDTIAQIQTIDDQLFIQTRTGLLVAVDIRTGRIQWQALLGNGGYANVFPVGANSQFVYAVHVTKLYCFYRYTGATEFVAELSRPTIAGFGGPPVTGPVADETGVYLVLGVSPGTAGAHRVAVYNLPRPITIPDASRNIGGRPADRDPRAVHPVDELRTRYPVEGAARTGNVETFEPYGRRPVQEMPSGGYSGARSPSLAALPSVTPPYTLEGAPISPSLTTLPSLRQPYRLRNDFQRDIQRTPSVSTIPPTVAANMALTDLRPRAVEPTLRWELGTRNRVIYPLVLTPYRVWGMGENRYVVALSKADKAREVAVTVQDEIAAPPGQAETIGYVPLADGNLYAVDLTTGNLAGGLNLLWRATVGGIMNRTPVVTFDSVYAAGDNSGVARVDRKTGDVVWKSPSTADRVIAVNQEFVYVRDRQGRLLVFDAHRATDPARRLTLPLSGMDLPEFNVPVVNTSTDRVFLAADNGLVVCLRDASAKYARPIPIGPPPTVNPPPKAAVSGDKPGDQPMGTPSPRKD
jgi:outer membrane protein assembly factor BamB